ncbi:MAG: WHG domain-containing protein [Pseudomonadota bacterium]
MQKPKSDTEAAILEEAARIVADEGAQALAARRVAAAAGCSVGTLYNLFGHLDGVVRAVNRQTMRLLAEQLSAQLSALPQATARDDRLTALAMAYLDFGLAEPNRWEALFRYRLQTPAEPPQEAEALFDILRAEAGEGVEDEALTALWAAVHGVVELAVSRRLPVAPAGAERRMIALILTAGLTSVASPR